MIFKRKIEINHKPDDKITVKNNNMLFITTL